ncbi:MAG: regulatory protein RecX [Parachlamydiaceae bacterium]
MPRSLRETAIAYLSRRSCHSKELESYLKRKGFFEVEGLIEEFKRLGYLNDEEWLKAYERSEARKGRSKKASNFKLFQKGIHAKVNSCDDEALDLAILKKTKGLEISEENRPKLIAYLIRKGFSYEKVLSKLKAF